MAERIGFTVAMQAFEDCVLHLKDMILRQTRPGTQLLCTTLMIFVAFFFLRSLKRMKDKKIRIWKTNFHSSLQRFLHAKLSPVTCTAH